MERLTNCWTLATLAALVILSCPASSRCKEHTYKAPSENKPEHLHGDFADLKRYHDQDYDSFVGLMGRRSADRRTNNISRKRDMDDVFVGLLGRRTSEPRMSNPWREGKYSQTRGDVFTNHGRLRFQRFM